MFIMSFNVHCGKTLCYCSAEGAIKTSVGSVHVSYILSSDLVVRLNARTSMSCEVFKLSPIFHLVVYQTDFLQRPIKPRDKKKRGNRHVKRSLSKISNTLFVYETIKIYRKQQQVGCMYKTILNLFTR